MAIEPAAFWRTDYIKNPPLTDEMVAHAEKTLGVVLPPAFVALLRVQNGGYTRGFVIPTTQRTSWAADHVAVSELFGISMAEPPSAGHSILDTEYMTAEWELPPKQVLLAGDGHWWITLDYRDGDIPSVAWLDVEVGEDIQLAPTFDEFLERLLPDSAVDETGGRLKPGSVKR